jgi:hypothetical protein
MKSIKDIQNAAVEAQRRADLYYAALQSNKHTESSESKEPDIIVSPCTTASEKVIVESKPGEPDFMGVDVHSEWKLEETYFMDVDGGIHLAPAPTEADYHLKYYVKNETGLPKTINQGT